MITLSFTSIDTGLKEMLIEHGAGIVYEVRSKICGGELMGWFINANHRINKVKVLEWVVGYIQEHKLPYYVQDNVPYSNFFTIKKIQ